MRERARLKHERELDIRRHLLDWHGYRVTGSVKLSTHMRHRDMHRKGNCDHSHGYRKECIDAHTAGRKCACHATH